MCLIIIYFLQGSLYPSGSIISQLTLTILISFNSFFGIKVLGTKRKPIFISIWSIFIAIIIIGYLFAGDFTKPLFFGQLKNILYFMTALYPIYYWTTKGVITLKDLRIFSFVMLPVLIITFYTNETNLKVELDREGVVNNASYMLVSLMPFLMLIKKRSVSLMIIFLILSLLIIGSKRGALAIGMVTAMLIIYYNLKYIKGKNLLSKARNMLVIVGILSFGLYYLSEVIESNFYIFERIQKNHSTRPENYLAIFNNWYNSSSFTELLFGYGYFSTPLYTPEEVMAHNDWLEMLNDFGLFGFFLYAVLLYSFINAIKYHESIELKYMHLSIIIIWIFTSVFSMWMNNYSNVIYAIAIGYIIGKISINNQRTLH